MSTKQRILCGVPKERCTGATTFTDQMLPDHYPKTHASRSDAFRCMAKHLVEQGYERIGQREFRSPNGDGILVLTKRIRYGGELRTGKGSDKGGQTNSRFQPKRGSGLIY